MPLLLLQSADVATPTPPPPTPAPPLDPSDRLATYTVEVAWSRRLPGIAVLDTSTLGGADLLGSDTFYAYSLFGGPYDDITARSDNRVRVENIKWTVGRSSDLTEMQALSATITGRDPTGMMNIHNPSSPLNLGDFINGDNKPLRPVRVTCDFQGDTYPVMLGFLRSVNWEADGRSGRFTLEVTDLSIMLETPRKDQPNAGVFPVIPYVSPCTTGQAIGLVLDYIGFTDTSLRLLDTGDTLPFFEAVGDRSAMQIITELVQANLGLFYIDKQGRPVFADRNNRFLRPVNSGIENEMHALGSGPSIDTVKNKWTVTAQTRIGSGQYQDGVPQVVEDETSERDYGERSDSFSSPYIASDSLALQIAQQLTAATKDPLNPIWNLALDNRTAEQMYAMLTLDVIDRIAVQEAETNSAGIFFVEQISGNIDAQGHKHSVSYLLSDRSAVAAADLDPFLLGTDVLDGPKVLSF